MAQEPDRSDFAATTAAAYVRQFHPDHEWERVMNEMVVTYDLDSGEFGMQSSLSPFQDDVVAAMDLEDGCFGDMGDVADWPEAIEAFLMDIASDSYWAEVLAAIDVATESTGEDA